MKKIKLLRRKHKIAEGGGGNTILLKEKKKSVKDSYMVAKKPAKI